MTDVDSETELPARSRTSRLPFRRTPDTSAAPAGPIRFTIRLSLTEDGRLRVEAAGPPGSAEADSVLPDLPRGEEPSGDAPQPDFLRERQTGVRLYNAVFVPHILRLLEESRVAAGEQPLPIDLVVDDPALVALPWELLRDPETDRFIALAESARFSRVAPEHGAPPPLLPIPPIGDLKVAVVAPELGESEIALAQAVGTDKRVVVSLAPAGGVLRGSPNVVQSVGEWSSLALPGSMRLLVIDGDAAAASAALLGAPAVLALPPQMTSEERATFLSAFYAELALGDPPDAAATAARRAVAERHSATELDWALPILITRGAPQSVVMPPRNVAGAVGRRAKEETVGWVKSTLSGAVSSVVLFLVGLMLFRLGVSGTPSLSFSVISPYSLYASFKALVLELSTFSDYFLFGAAVAFALLAIGSTYLWRRRRKLALPAGQHDRWFFDLLSPVSSLRSVSFFGMAAITVLGAFAYQQYLWNVLLPIDDDALGIAITRDTAAATFSDDLADSLFAEGQTRNIVIRELPVKFDARDTGKAREMGKRIGAEAVVIYRAETDETTGADEYVAYVVFTDPTVGFSVAGAPNPAGPSPGPSTQQSTTLNVRDGAAIPVIRTEQMTELVNSAAGIIAYQEGDYRGAILHLSKVELGDKPDTGIVAYYLGSALDFDGRPAEAATAFEQAIAFYEARQAAPGGLGPQDTLLLVKTYLERGRIERFKDNWDGALAWYQKGVALREQALARADDLDRPSDVPAVFARLYAEMAEVYRITGDTEQNRFWQTRSNEEAAAIAAIAGDDAVALNQEAMAYYFSGSCVDALAADDRAIAADPDTFDAYIGASAIAYFQGRPGLAADYLNRYIERHPNDVRAREQLGFFYWAKVITADGYFEPAYLTNAEALFQQILAIDPTNATARSQLADVSTWRGDGALTDLTALMAGDDLNVAKSQSAWPADPERVSAALAAYADEIDQRRTIATELGQGDINLELELANAYYNRQQLLYNTLVARYGNGLDDAMRADGEQLLADAAQIRQWTATAIAGGPDVTRLQQMEGWVLFLKSIDREWGWYSFFAEDQQTAAQLQTEYVDGFAKALALTESAPLETADEMNAGSQIYFSGSFLALAFENDTAKSQDYQNKALKLATDEATARGSSTATYETTCGEERERRAGLAALAADDLDGAAQHYDAALALNPNHVPTLLAASALATQRGDHATAAARAETATQADPQNEVAWERLALATLALGDTARSDVAWNRLLELAGTEPTQHRLHTLTTTTNELIALAAAQPDLVLAIQTRIQPLADATAALDAEAGKTYQLPALYAAIGKLALWTGQPAQAEPLLAKSLTLDPHQPAAQALAAIAALAQGRDGTPEIEAAVSEVSAEFWSSIYTYHAPELLDIEEATISDYLTRFPEQAGSLQPFKDAIATERDQLKTGSS